MKWSLVVAPFSRLKHTIHVCIMFILRLIFVIFICNFSLHSLFHTNLRAERLPLPLLVLLQDSDILTLALSSHRSWWRDNGPGCKSEGLPSAGWQNQENPELTTVPSCWLEYQYIEILHCIVQLLISVSVSDTLHRIFGKCVAVKMLFIWHMGFQQNYSILFLNPVLDLFTI